MNKTKLIITTFFITLFCAGYSFAANTYVIQNETLNAGETKEYRAQETIVAMNQVIVQPAAGLRFQAGTMVHLKPGFYAKSGSNFYMKAGGVVVSDEDYALWEIIRTWFASHDVNADIDRNIISVGEQILPLNVAFPNSLSNDFVVSIPSNDMLQFSLLEEIIDNENLSDFLPGNAAEELKNLIAVVNTNQASISDVEMTFAAPNFSLTKVSFDLSIDISGISAIPFSIKNLFTSSKIKIVLANPLIESRIENISVVSEIPGLEFLKSFEMPICVADWPFGGADITLSLPLGKPLTFSDILDNGSGTEQNLFLTEFTEKLGSFLPNDFSFDFNGIQLPTGIDITGLNAFNINSVSVVFGKDANNNAVFKELGVGLEFSGELSIFDTIPGFSAKIGFHDLMLDLHKPVTGNMYGSFSGRVRIGEENSVNKAFVPFTIEMLSGTPQKYRVYLAKNDSFAIVSLKELLGNFAGYVSIPEDVLISDVELLLVPSNNTNAIEEVALRIKYDSLLDFGGVVTINDAECFIKVKNPLSQIPEIQNIDVTGSITVNPPSIDPITFDLSIPDIEFDLGNFTFDKFKFDFDGSLFDIALALPDMLVNLGLPNITLPDLSSFFPDLSGIDISGVDIDVDITHNPFGIDLKGISFDMQMPGLSIPNFKFDFSMDGYNLWFDFNGSIDDVFSNIPGILAEFGFPSIELPSFDFLNGLGVDMDNVAVTELGISLAADFSFNGISFGADLSSLDLSFIGLPSNILDIRNVRVSVDKDMNGSVQGEISISESPYYFFRLETGDRRLGTGELQKIIWLYLGDGSGVVLSVEQLTSMLGSASFANLTSFIDGTSVTTRNLVLTFVVGNSDISLENVDVDIEISSNLLTDTIPGISIQYPRAHCIIYDPFGTVPDIEIRDIQGIITISDISFTLHIFGFDLDTFSFGNLNFDFDASLADLSLILPNLLTGFGFDISLPAFNLFFPDLSAINIPSFAIDIDPLSMDFEGLSINMNMPSLCMPDFSFNFDLDGIDLWFDLDGSFGEMSSKIPDLFTGFGLPSISLPSFDFLTKLGLNLNSIVIDEFALSLNLDWSFNGISFKADLPNLDLSFIGLPSNILRIKNVEVFVDKDSKGKLTGEMSISGGPYYPFRLETGDRRLETEELTPVILFYIGDDGGVTLTVDQCTSMFGSTGISAISSFIDGSVTAYDLAMVFKRSDMSLKHISTDMDISATWTQTNLPFTLTNAKARISIVDPLVDADVEIHNVRGLITIQNTNFDMYLSEFNMDDLTFGNIKLGVNGSLGTLVSTIPDLLGVLNISNVLLPDFNNLGISLDSINVESLNLDIEMSLGPLLMDFEAISFDAKLPSVPAFVLTFRDEGIEFRF